MAGGYAQLAYGVNYYGTVCSNRDEFVIVRKLPKVDWLDHSNLVDRAIEESASLKFPDCTRWLTTARVSARGVWSRPVTLPSACHGFTATSPLVSGAMRLAL
jgi:hypothetical protein